MTGRCTPKVNRTCTAEVTAYVAVHHRGGFSASVRLLAGAGEPTTLLGALTSSTGGSFVGGVVLAGETWTIASAEEPGRGELFALATPLA